MSLSLESTSKSYGPGVLVSKATVVEITDISGTMPEGFTRKIDLGIEVTLEIGQSFQPKVRIFGSPGVKKGRVTWGGAFPLRDFFKKAGCAGGLSDDLKIPADWLTKPVGKEVYRLSYASHMKKKGGVGYSDWKILGFVEAGDTPEEMAARFLEEHGKTGYPKNYKPELMDSDGDFSFPPEDEPEAPPMASLWSEMFIDSM